MIFRRSFFSVRDTCYSNNLIIREIGNIIDDPVSWHMKCVIDKQPRSRLTGII
jgi:hypothetical protein